MKKRKGNKKKFIAASAVTLLLTCAILGFTSFNLQDGTLRGIRTSLADSVIDGTNRSEQLRDLRVNNYYRQLEYREEQARLEQERLEREAREAAARLEQERLEQERQQRALAEEMARQQLKQDIADYAEAVAKGDATSDAMKGIIFNRNKNAKGMVALSFDDGPSKTHTAKYVDILKEYGARATFFTQAMNVKRYPEATQAIIDAGFELGCHSYDHGYMNKLSDAKFREELEKCEAVLEDYQHIVLFRYPYGSYNERVNKVLKEYDMISVLWSVDPQDWAGPDVKTLTSRIVDVAKDGDIILLHEGKNNTLEALPGILKGLQDRGLEIVTVSELLYYGDHADATSVSGQ